MDCAMHLDFFFVVAAFVCHIKLICIRDYFYYLLWSSGAVYRKISNKLINKKINEIQG